MLKSTPFTLAAMLMTFNNIILTQFGVRDSTMTELLLVHGGFFSITNNSTVI